MRSNGERGGDFGGFTQYQDLFKKFDHNRNRYSNVAVVVMDLLEDYSIQNLSHIEIKLYSFLYFAQ